MLAAIVISVLLANGGTSNYSDQPLQCDELHVNHYYDDYGRLVLDQILARDFDRFDGRFHVAAWEIYKPLNRIRQTPRGYIASMNGRDVMAPVKSESWTQYDIELLDDEKFIPRKRRRFSLLGQQHGRRDLSDRGGSFPWFLLAK